MPRPLGDDADLAHWKRILEPTEQPANYWYRLTGEDGTLAGIAGLQEIDYVNGNAVLPVFLAEDARRQGLGTRVSALLLVLAFSYLRLTRVTSYFREDNGSSRKMTEGLGFEVEGRLRAGSYFQGKRYDTFVIGILEPEWSQARIALREQLDSDVRVYLGQVSERTPSWPPPAGREM